LVLFAVHYFLQPEFRAIEQSLLFRVAIPLLVLPSLVVIFIHRSGLLPPRRMLELGIVFAIVVSSGIALLEFGRTQVPVQTALGISAVPMWILAFGIFVPNSPIRTFLAALISGCTVLAAYLFSQSVMGIPAWKLSDLMLWLTPSFLMAGWTYFLSRDLYQIEMDMNAAREAGSYSLERLLGRGGMGEVWAARHRALRSGAAVKLIRPEALIERTGREAHVLRRRFEQEARATARLRSPHTVALHDFGMSEDGNFYYAMELLEGLELETLISRFGPQPGSRVVHILGQVCDSLAEAHYHGLIHRDIKPSNVFLARLGMNFDFVKVLDFGLVKLDNSAHSRLTVDGTTAGTPAYMAPELATGAPYDARVDIYGLGCVGYFLLTGAPVFDEPSPVAVALAHVQKQPVPPSQRTELGVPVSLERAILSCLAKDPADRPQSAVELAHLLVACEDVGIWTHENAENWWRAHLPDSFTAKDESFGEALSTVR
jgi:serine/threonine-protein kinase